MLVVRRRVDDSSRARLLSLVRAVALFAPAVLAVRSPRVWEGTCEARNRIWSYAAVRAPIQLSLEAGETSGGGRRSVRTVARAAGKRTPGFRGAAVLLAGIWLLGLFALAAVIQFESRADKTRRAPSRDLEHADRARRNPADRFRPATVAKGAAPQAQTARQLAQAKLVLSGSMARSLRRVTATLRNGSQPSTDATSSSSITSARLSPMGLLGKRRWSSARVSVRAASRPT